MPNQPYMQTPSSALCRRLKLETVGETELFFKTKTIQYLIYAGEQSKLGNYEATIKAAERLLSHYHMLF